MSFSKQEQWKRFKQYYADSPSIGLAIDSSRMYFSDDFMQQLEPRMQKAFDEMATLEKGTIANPDENRMVGHYWMRNPSSSPTPDIRREIEETISRVKSFAEKVHHSLIHGTKGTFKHYLLIGIGGSALGPQFVANALGHPPRDRIISHSFDNNTDPDGMERVLAAIGKELAQTLCVVVSKFGGTKETRNCMLAAKAAYEAAGLDFGDQFVAITQQESELDRFANQAGCLGQFPMCDWADCRTSDVSTVGLLPAALQGCDTERILAGAGACYAAAGSGTKSSTHLSCLFC